MSPRCTGAPLRYVTTISPERRRVVELAVRLHRVRLVRAPEHARRQVDVLRVDRVGDFVDADLPARERGRVELDAHRVLAPIRTPSPARRPAIIEMRCAMNVSANSSSCEIGIVVDVNA